ncbi:hypothetical protein [Psychromicrobium xiongbiense]|uniref:hypothetical protein n=1 Tax=Psychromicrobium xiongbiense TaxID=3051184 RepID=UPI0025533365|nr:hypothetical protein [Psychromicrobium sp. YIM S02556]
MKILHQHFQVAAGPVGELTVSYALLNDLAMALQRAGTDLNKSPVVPQVTAFGDGAVDMSVGGFFAEVTGLHDHVALSLTRTVSQTHDAAESYRLADEAMAAAAKK